MASYLSKFRDAWKFIVLLLLSLTVFSYAMFQGGFVSWFLFYSFIPFGIYSFLLQLYPIRNFHVERVLNHEVITSNQKLIGTIRISRNLPFPLFYLMVEEQFPKLYRNKQDGETKKLFFPWFKKSFTMQYSLSNLPRGEYSFSSIRVRTGDLFGLIEKEYYFNVQNSILVYPTSVNIGYTPKEKLFEQGGISRLDKNMHNSLMAVGIREYQPGDKFAWIDWKATARRDSIMTKEFEQLYSKDVMIILDRTKSELFEEMVIYTASLLRAIGSSVRVGFVSIGKSSEIYKLHSSERHSKALLLHLAKVQGDSETPFSKVLEQHTIDTKMNQVSRIIITSLLTKSMVNKLCSLNMYKQEYTVYLIKKEQEILPKEEKSLINQLKVQGITVKVLSSYNMGKWFKEVSSS